jgi:hypothetical protein
LARPKQVRIVLKSGATNDKPNASEADGKSDQTLDEKLSKIGEVTVTLTRCRELRREPRPHTVDVSTYPLVYEGATPEKAVNGRAISCHTQ